VTGASRGIGRACALALARAGCDVAVHFNANAADANALVAEVAQVTSRRAEAFQANLSSAGAAKDLIEEVAASFGAPTVLVHAAGTIVEKPLSFTSVADWDAQFELNAFSAAALSQALLRYVRKSERGRIVYVSSLAAESGLGNGAAYAADKGALTGLCKSLALEAARWKTTVNCVAPGYIATDMTQAHDDQKRAANIANIPLGRYGTPEDVAAIVAFLCSEQAGWITGQTFVIDGGMSLGV
jgi:3-oxoacyl-[acyl-carrier protein] reductase